MSCCMGFLKRKRPKSLPPGGSQVKDKKKNATIKNLVHLNNSLPNIDIYDDEKTLKKDATKSHTSNRINDENETLNDENEIYPAPLSFREPTRSPDLESDAKTRTWDPESDALKSFNQKLKKELDNPVKPKSARSITKFDQNGLEIQLEDIQKLTQNFNIDKQEIDKLKNENKNFLNENEKLKHELLERGLKSKEENDFLIATVHTALSKDLRTDKERDSLTRLFVSKQTEKNEALIREQSSVIEHLKHKCLVYEEDIKILIESRSESAWNTQVNELNREVSLLRNLVYRLNVELSSYQAKYPSPSLKTSLKKIDLASLPSRGPIPIWLVNSKYLSPLVGAYDDKIKEKDEQIKLLKLKMDELSQKLTGILEENSQLHSKLDKVSFNLGPSDAEDSELRKQIRHHAMLVLEENKALNEQLDFQQDKLLEAQRHTIIEIGNLSKRIIISETEKTDLKNHIETLKFNYDELNKKFNDCLAEAQRRVKLQDHLSQTGELKKQLEETDIYHKLEYEQLTKRIETLEYERKELTIKNKNFLSENRKLLAENKVLDKALNDGLGRKMQRHLKDLEKRLELSQIQEQNLLEEIQKLTQDIEQLKKDKETYENMFKTSQIEVKKYENKQLEENVKLGKIEGKFDDYKQKTLEKINYLSEKLKQKDSEFLLIKLENDKKITDLLNLLHKKQDQIDDLIQEKRQMEGELEMVWQSTSAQNRRLKDALLDNIRESNRPINDFNSGFNSSIHKLLIED
ncbi:unnamed protein product [Brachionus calyciflorus]|uniref:Uncharacterized protein n=1 Tax=Brachionus calyciflorus TaxID=104777 RepID=A0A813PQY3_9BILA|nr:unnamed protein product [Brachionus calyciflorus]